MSEQVMIDRELMDLAEKAIKQKMCVQCEGVPCCWTDGLEALAGIRAAKPVSAQPDHSAQHLNMDSAKPAGEVPEVAAWVDCSTGYPSKHKRPECEPLMTVAQHTRIVAALQARAADAWISVSGQLPLADGQYWCFFSEEHPSTIKQGVCIFIERHQQFCDWTVTHWMPLPAAPTAEHKAAEVDQ